MTINVPGIQHIVIEEILDKHGIVDHEVAGGKIKYTEMRKDFTYTLSAENLTKFKTWEKPPTAPDVNKIDPKMNPLFQKMVDEVKKNTGHFSKAIEWMNDNSSIVPTVYDIASKFRSSLRVYKGGYVYYSDKKPREYEI